MSRAAARPYHTDGVQGGVGVEDNRPAQQEGEKFHTLLQDRRGELRDHADGVKCVVSGRDSNSIRQHVDDGVGSGIGS